MLFILRGTSCSGKSTFASKYFTNPNFILSSDRFREILHGSNKTVFQFNSEVFDLMHQILETRLIHKVDYTVWDATCLRVKDMSTLLEMSKKYHTPVTIISIEPPELDVLLARNKERAAETGFHVPENILERHRDRYFNCMEYVIEEAINNPYCSLIEINQSMDVIRTID